ncbi:MAG: type III-A CRISPR-associated RAMP protein Csm4 [Archaeoglobus sp.]|nr:MAG: type III-A CRISPR-associated RAMP protein Csm4 [Archaeoglobus sp.]
MKAIKLYFKTPIRSGVAGLGLESSDSILHSDTLFGAIANALSKMNEDVEEFIEKFRSREILITSCFPFKGDSYYLPNLHLPNLPQNIRKKRFLAKSKFEKLISGDIPEKISDVDFMKKMEIPKVVLDRTTSNSGIYYLSCVKFEGESGLYFLVSGKDKMIEVALKYLEDEGIGGKKTWGLGKFEFKVDDFRLKDGGDNYVTLSLTLPTDLSKIRYWKPITRSGWINTPNGTFRKPKVIMASEGTIFKGEENGDLLDLDTAYSDLSKKVGHKVYLNGMSFLIRAEV